MILAQTDIGNVPAEFVKYFFIMLGFVLTGFVAFRKGTQARGTKDEPVNVQQPLEVKRTPEYALKEETSSDLAKLETSLTAMSRESMRQAQHTSDEIAGILKSGAEREGRLLAAVHDMEKRFTKLMIEEVKSLHVRMNPVGESVAAHAASLKGHDSRIATLERTVSDNIQRLHDRFNDLIKQRK